MATKKKIAPTATERVAKHRAQVEADGGKQIAVMLSGKAAAKLKKICEREGITQTALINQLLEGFR